VNRMNQRNEYRVRDGCVLLHERALPSGPSNR
jgi:hypothetical protein